jgi:hypothetical protein
MGEMTMKHIRDTCTFLKVFCVHEIERVIGIFFA